MIEEEPKSLTLQDVEKIDVATALPEANSTHSSVPKEQGLYWQISGGSNKVMTVSTPM